MPRVVKTKTVPALGVGRKDYSVNVEFAVQPLIRSYQSPYNYNNTVNIPAGGSEILNINASAGYMVLLHDLVLSVPANVLIGLKLEVLVEGVPGFTIEGDQYQSIAEHYAQGNPFQTIRITLYNYSALALDFKLTLNGFQVTLQEYHQAVA